MKPIALSRRTLLRGAGVAVALPTLDAMLTDGGLLVGTAGAQPRKLPPRMVVFFIPNGVPASPESTFTFCSAKIWDFAKNSKAELSWVIVPEASAIAMTHLHLIWRSVPYVLKPNNDCDRE